MPQHHQHTPDAAASTISAQKYPTAQRPRPTQDSRQKPDADEILTTRVLEQLAAGTVPWRRPWTTTAGDGIPRNLATGRRYRGVNILLLWMTPFGSPWWLTYKQARSLGGQVRRGEHHTPIVVWKQIIRQLNTPARLQRARNERRQITTDKQGRPICVVVFSRIYRGFNLEQVDGLDKHPALQPVPEPTWDPLTVCEQTVDGYRDGPAVAIGGERAYYQPDRDQVRMPDRGRFADATGWYATLFHELAHSTGARGRLNRSDLTDAPGIATTAYAREELTAELAAAMLCAHCQVDTSALTGQHAAYLDQWRQRVTDDPRLILIAAQRAQHACDLILDHRPVSEPDATTVDANATA